jgi:hypothetical protein
VISTSEPISNTLRRQQHLPYISGLNLDSSPVTPPREEGAESQILTAAHAKFKKTSPRSCWLAIGSSYGYAGTNDTHDLTALNLTLKVLKK